jgi:hypothetical protein
MDIEQSAASAPPPPRGWWARNWKWFVPTGCLTLLAFFAAFVAVIVIIVFSAIKSSDVAQTAIAKAKRNADVIDALGSPLKDGLFVSGNVNTSGGTGHADLSIPISGPKGSGTIYATAEKSAGVWKYSVLVVKIKRSGEQIDLNETAPPGL